MSDPQSTDLGQPPRTVRRFFSRVGRWLVTTWRRPAVAATVATTGLLTLFQGVFILMAMSRFDLNFAACLGLLKFSSVVSLATMLVLLPVLLLLRRAYPTWRQGDRQQATFAAGTFLMVAIIVWILADAATAAFGVPEALAPWLELGVALLAGALTPWLRVVPVVRSATTFMAIVFLAIFFFPFPKPPHASSSSDQPGDMTTVGAEVAADVVADGTAQAWATTTSRKHYPDVVLLTVDTLRADRLGPFGGSLMPHVDQLAAQGVVFSRALSAAPWTCPSISALLTGLPSVRHGAGRIVRPDQNFQRTPLPDELVTVAERFSAAGYRTRAISANSQVSSWTGMAQGFDEFVDAQDGAGAVGFLSLLPLPRLIVSLVPIEKFPSAKAAALTEQALAWLAEDDPAPLFLWVHYNDPHVPLSDDPERAITTMEDPSAAPQLQEDGTLIGDVFVATDGVRSGRWWLRPQDRERLVSYYDRAVGYTDQQLGRVLASIRERSRTRQVVVAFTADHGEELWDHGHYEHGHDYYREVTHVPLVFWGPGIVDANILDDTVVGQVDVAPTLLELAGVRPLPTRAVDEGRSLAPLLQQGHPAHFEPRPRFCGGNLYGLPAVLVEDGPWRLILRANDKVELYDVTTDPAEEYNVASLHPEVVTRYREMLDPRLDVFVRADRGEQVQLSTEQRLALRSLGYAQ